MAQLAIKGHATKGKEVIEILKMLGGTNRKNSWGIFANSLYLINTFGDIEDRSLSDNSNYQTYTLEEFLEKFPYKVGDKVIVKGYKQVFEILSMRWCSERNDVLYSVSNSNEWFYTEELQPYKEETMNNKFKSLNVETYLKVWDETENGLEVCVAEGYEMIEKNGQFYIVKKKPKYPTTYEECCEVLSLCEDDRLYTKGYKASLIQNFQKLLICRDAYWKIAGEEMGLDKPWVPTWTIDTEKFVIYIQDNVICLNRFLLGHNMLAFPTKEMRDAFYENFKELIEECKEFL